MDDTHDFVTTLEKLDVLGLGGDVQARMLRLIAAVLILGNVHFEADPAASDDRLRVVGAESGPFATACALLGVAPAGLATKLTSRTISAGKGSSTYTVTLRQEQCVDTRDALSQAVYAALFEWLVTELNELQKGGLETATSEDAERFVGLLDIFGFENFARNSFEQLCINFTNERLQAHFMDALVKLRLEEYKSEGIDYSAVDFPDNSAQVRPFIHPLKKTRILRRCCAAICRARACSR